MDKGYYKEIDKDTYTDIVFPDDLVSQIGKRRRVVLKPAASTKAPLSFTNPLLVKALADHLSRHGYEVIIAEGMHLKHLGVKVLKVTEYTDLLFKDYRFIDLEHEVCRTVDVDCGELKQVAVPEVLFGEDVTTINMPKLKTHIMTLITGAIKNVTMGMSSQNTKARIHRIAGGDYPLLTKMLVEVYLKLEPLIALTVVDAIEAMVGFGPSYGTKYKMNKIFIGDAIDLEYATAAALGFDDSPFCQYLASQGIRPTRDFPLADQRQPVPPTYRHKRHDIITRWFNADYWFMTVFRGKTLASDWFFIAIDRKRCTECLECRAHCPVGAISKDPVAIDDDKCTRCLCCVENCPENAMQMKTSKVMDWLDKHLSRFW